MGPVLAVSAFLMTARRQGHRARNPSEMQTCSHCRRTYSDRTCKCASCGTHLLHVVQPGERPRGARSSSNHKPPEGLTVVCCCQSQWEADFVRALLDAEGIAVAQRPTPAVTSLAYIPPITSGIEILVRAEDEEDARDVILSGRQDMPAE
jgi:hypothetical protein